MVDPHLMRTFFCHWGAGLIWLQVEARLAELYRRAERPEDAKRLEDELRILLSAADPDHPNSEAASANPDEWRPGTPCKAFRALKRVGQESFRSL